MRKVLKLNEFVEIYNEVKEDQINESVDFESLTPAEIEALIYNQIIAVEEDEELTEGLKDILASVGNPVTFVKIKSGANKYKKGLIAKYKIENEFNDKKDDADTKEEKDRLDVLKKQKLTAIDDKIKAIADKMDGDTEGKPTLQKLASLMRTKAKIKAAEAGIKDADDRADIIDKLNTSAARKEEALVKAAEQRKKPKETETSVSAPSGKKPAPAPSAPASPAKKKVASQAAPKEEDTSKDAKSMNDDALEKKVRELKSERESDAATLASLREKLTGRSVAGKNGVIEKIEDLKSKLAKASATSKTKIQAEIETLEKEKAKLEAEIKSQEEGKALTDKLYTTYSNELQSRKK